MTQDDAEPSFVGDPPRVAEPEVMHDRRELALVAVERTRMPMVVSDPRQPDNPIVLANEAFLELTGYPAEEVIGRNCRFLQGKDTDPAAVAEIRMGIEARAAFIEVELINYRKDGSVFLNQLPLVRSSTTGARSSTISRLRRTSPKSAGPRSLRLPSACS